MASTRRPTYRPTGSGTRGRPAEPDAAESQTPQSGLPESRRAPQPGVISASKSAHVEPAGLQSEGEKAAVQKAVRQKAVRQKAAADAGPGNVLAFPEPKGKRIRRNAIIAACIVAALVAGVLVAAVYSPLLAVRSVTVNGTKLLKPAQVQAALKPLEGKPLPQITDGEVDGLLKPLVQIKSVTTQAHPPSTLVVQVQERIPVALVKRGAQYILVDVDGVQLSSTDAPAKVKLPVIDGGAGAIGKDLFQATAAVLGALPASVLAKLSNASARSVDAVELKLVDGQTVVWGNAGEKELKARVLEALLKVPADPASPVKVYDVSVPRHPVTR
ncbi:MAG: FtsQ-type POTRA domain-containing protein [Actinomycetota bacterium]|nr:FtsQ-type POTRA domain-containing protein [Actinomycetota bacterium]